MRTLIVDDEPVARQILREELETMPQISAIAEAANGIEALHYIREQHPDVVFLDLQMPGLGGFEVVQQLQGTELPAIVIVTAYDSFAIKAFEAGAMDYLLKPVRQTRLRQSVERAQQLIGNRQQSLERLVQLQEVAAARTPSAPQVRKIVGRAGEDYVLLNSSEVMAFEADGDIVWILTARQKLQATLPLKALQEKLQHAGFVRIHRGALINVDHVRTVSALPGQRWILTLQNEQAFVVSKRQARHVKELLSR